MFIQTRNPLYANYCQCMINLELSTYLSYLMCLITEHISHFLSRLDRRVITLSFCFFKGYNSELNLLKNSKKPTMKIHQSMAYSLQFNLIPLWMISTVFKAFGNGKVEVIGKLLLTRSLMYFPSKWSSFAVPYRLPLESVCHEANFSEDIIWKWDSTL